MGRRTSYGLPATLRVSGAPWLQLAFQRVTAAFIASLARAPGWRQIYLISPWISRFGAEAGLTFKQFLKRIVDEDVALYVVTRPQDHDWHKAAVDDLKATGKANIVELGSLHTKLFIARTVVGQLALLGSANLTSTATVRNTELGVLVTDRGQGTEVVRILSREASAIYRDPGRNLVATRSDYKL